MVDRQRGPGAGDQLRQRGRGLARLLGALGRAGRAAQGDQVDADAPQPAGDLADARPGHVALGRGDAAQLHRGALRGQQGAAWCAWPSTAATACASCAPTPASPTTSATQGTLQLFRTQKQLDGIGKDIEILKQYGVPYEVLDRDGYIAVEPALAEVQRQVRRRAAPARRRDRRLLQVHQHAGRDGRGAGRRRSATASPIEAIVSRGRAHHRRAHRAAALLTRRRLRGRAGQLLAAAAAPLGHRPAGLPGQGLLDHRADHRRRAARPNRPSWTRPTRSPSRAWATASASAARPSSPATTCAARGAPRDAGARRDRPVPARRRRHAGRVLVRPAPDDARRHARSSAPRATPTCTSPPATARWAGRWPPAPAA